VKAGSMVVAGAVYLKGERETKAPGQRQQLRLYPQSFKVISTLMLFWGTEIICNNIPASSCMDECIYIYS
jgi:hypothetical protein